VALLEAATRAAADKQGEIQTQQGSLQQVGGNIVREDKDELDAALQIAIDRQDELEIEYSAWKLLAETLREAENTEGAHLGRTLTIPLSSRFRDLSAGRYDKISIDSHLKTEGPQASGLIRPFSTLSDGTRDQLATLFRLCIAEHLRSAIILDDHLSQSDPDKIEWFRGLLRKSGENIQVVLITCRPHDYLDQGEFPSADEELRDSPDGLLRAVNLGRSIVRFPLVAG
jgi:hypothetical protein